MLLYYSYYSITPKKKNIDQPGCRDTAMAAKMPRGFPTYLAPRRCARGCLMQQWPKKSWLFHGGKWENPWLPSYNSFWIFLVHHFSPCFLGNFGGLLSRFPQRNGPLLGATDGLRSSCLELVRSKRTRHHMASNNKGLDEQIKHWLMF